MVWCSKSSGTPGGGGKADVADGAGEAGAVAGLRGGRARVATSGASSGRRGGGRRPRSRHGRTSATQEATMGRAEGTPQEKAEGL